MKMLFVILVVSLAVPVANASADQPKYNVLFIISDDLTYTALSCYGNTVCTTPNIDRLAARGVRFTRAYCQGTYCGPSRASFMSGYYPHATGVLGYKNPRPQIGERATWSQHFKNNGYYTARVSKIFHMGVPGGIEKGGHGADDALSWTERFNSQGPEWAAAGEGETLEDNPDGQKPAVGGNTFVVVEADGDDLVHSDGKTAAKAVELIEQHKHEPFWLGVGFVRPHVPFVAPRSYFPPFKPFDNMVLPEKVAGDWDDIPRPGINYKTSKNMKMDIRRQKKAVGGYYASVAYMDAQVGKVLDALENAGIADKTIVIFTSDHGYHLGEHDFWAKVSLLDESSGVPLIISVPGKKPAVCNSLVELLDLYPTITALCGLEIPENIQGKDISRMLDDTTHEVRDAAFSAAPMRKGFLLRDHKYAFIQYGEDASGGIELYNVQEDPKQFTNLASNPDHNALVEKYKARMVTKIAEVRENDLPHLSSADEFPRFDAQVIDPYVGEVCYAVTVADINGDAKVDIVAVSERAVYWYENPHWTRRVIIEDQTPRDNVCIAAADIDSDGQVELALGAGWTKAGTIQLLSRGQSLNDQWQVHSIAEVPWLHRMRFADVLGKGTPQLVVSPLNKSDGKGVRLSAYEIPAAPQSDRWRPTILDQGLNRMHNHWHADLDGDSQLDTWTASQEGIHLIRRVEQRWTTTKISGGAAGETPELQGAGEIKLGRLRDGTNFIASVEPMHGNMAVVYTQQNDDTWRRKVIENTLKRGHAVWVADLDKDGSDELIIGHSDSGDGSIKGPGLYVYDAQDKHGNDWQKHVIDDGGIATEDAIAADFNGDGWIDIVAGGRSTHNLKLYMNLGK